MLTVMHAHTPVPQGLIETSCSDCVVLGCHNDTHMASCHLLILSTCSFMFQIWSKVSWNFDNLFVMQLDATSPLISSWNSIRYIVIYAIECEHCTHPQVWQQYSGGFVLCGTTGDSGGGCPSGEGDHLEYSGEGGQVGGDQSSERAWQYRWSELERAPRLCVQCPAEYCLGYMDMVVVVSSSKCNSKSQLKINTIGTATIHEPLHINI